MSEEYKACELTPHPPDSSVLTESNLANNWQRRSSRSSRTPRRSTPMTHPPMGSSTSSRRTLPESNCPFFLSSRVQLKLSEHLHRRHLSVQKTNNNSAFSVSRQSGNHRRSDVIRRKAQKDIYRLPVYICEPIKCVYKINYKCFPLCLASIFAHSGDVRVDDWRHFL